MAFSFKGRWAIFTIVTIVLVVTVTLLANNPSLKFSKLNPTNQSVQTLVGNNGSVGTGGSNGTAGTNGTRFVDTITKVVDVGKDRIQKQLDESSYASIIIELDGGLKNIDIVLSSLSPDEFILEEISRGTPPVITGNATKSAISKLENSSLVGKIYYNTGKGELFLQDSVSLINANIVWNISYGSSNLTGSNVTICIVDTGVNYSHPDLGGCNSSTFLAGNCSKVIGGYDYLDSPDDSDPMDTDEDGHGTHVTGIVAANGKIKGVAPDAKIVAVRALGTLSQMRDGIQWCIDNRNTFSPPIRIITLSGGTGELYESICDGKDIVVNKSNEAKYYGILMIAAVGNHYQNKSISSPACGSNVTSVSATNKFDVIENYSDRNSITDLVAPGGSINSTVGNQSSCPTGCVCSGSYMVCSGTSMAAPHVAATAALLIQRNPDLNPDQIAEVLSVTGKTINDSADSLHPNGSNLNFRRIDVLKAIMAVNASLLQVPSISEIYSNDTRKIYEFKILNANLSNITNISWQAIVENGSVVNSTISASLLYKQSVMVLFEQNFSKRGIADVNFSARADNLFYSKNYTAQAGDLYISQFNDLATNGTQKIYDFRIATNKTSNVTGINWSYDYGDNGNVSANQLTDLQPGKEIFVIVQRNYAGLANRILNATAFTTSRFAEKLKYLTYLNISGLSVLNSSNRYRIFGFNITNLYFKNLTGVFWNVTFGDGGERNVTQPLTVGPNETAFAMFDYNYTSAGNYTINVNATNASIIDKKSINISVI